MIPTSPSNNYYPGHYGSHIPTNLPAPVTSFEKIAAALLEVKKAPLVSSQPSFAEARFPWSGRSTLMGYPKNTP